MKVPAHWVAILNTTPFAYPYKWALDGVVKPNSYAVVDDTAATVKRGIAVGSFLVITGPTGNAEADAAVARAAAANAPGTVTVERDATVEERLDALETLTPSTIGAVPVDDPRLSDARPPLPHTQPSSTIDDFPVAVQGLIGSSIAVGANVTKTYDPATGVTTISVVAPGEWTNTDPEVVRDVIGGALAAGTNMSVAVNDIGDTITISTAATVNSSDAQLRDRTTHTGEQPVASVTGLRAELDGKASATDPRFPHIGTAAPADTARPWIDTR